MARRFNGWFKIHRKIFTNDILGSSPNLRHLFIDLCALANFQDGKAIVDGEVITLKRGQLLTSLTELELITGLSKPTVNRSLKLLENSLFLKRKVKRRGQVITICNYEEYQGLDDEPRNANETGALPQALPIIRNKENKNNTTCTSNEVTGTQKIPYKKIQDHWNQNPGIYPQINRMTSKRKEKLQIRWNEAQGDPFEYWTQCITRAQNTIGTWYKNFSFDWLLTNDTNHVKVMEGKYDQRDKPRAESVEDYGFLS